MSRAYYNELWQEAINDLQEQCIYEQVPRDKEEGAEGKKEKMLKSDFFTFWAQRYIRYIDIYKKLEECYDQMVHPQKRELLKNMLQSTMVRMCECKDIIIKSNDMYNFSIQSIFVNLDDLIMDLKLTPDYIDIPIPRYFAVGDDKDEAERLAKRNQEIDKLLRDYTDNGILPEEEEWEPQNKLEDTSYETAIRIIQKSERGRQGIWRAIQAKNLRKDEEKKQEKMKKIQAGQEVQDEEEKDDAALVIKKYWRGHMGREEVQKIRDKELLFLGMKLQKDDPNNEHSQSREQGKQRVTIKLQQEQNFKEYETKVEETKELVEKFEGNEKREQLLNQKRNYITNFLEQNNFQGLPKDASEIPDTINEMDEKAQEEEKAKEEDDGKGKAKGGKGAPKGKDKKGGKGSDQDDFFANNREVGPSKIVYKIQEYIASYEGEWNNDEIRGIDKGNFYQKLDPKKVKEQDAMPYVVDKIKGQVETLIDMELAMYKNIYGMHKGKKGKKGKGKKKGKKKKEKKRKFPGDAQLKRFKMNEDDMLAWLIEHRIVKKLPAAQLSDLKGESNVLGCIQEQRADDFVISSPDPSMLQIRQALVENIAIPLGSPYAKENLEKRSYFLFYGPQQSGKTLAVRALATQCNAMLIDLSPTNLTRHDQKVTERKVVLQIINLAIKVAIKYQPAIIYIEDFEMCMQGKGHGKKKKDLDPNLPLYGSMLKPLKEMKKLKCIQPTDRVVVICNTHKLPDASAKEMKRFFDRFIYFPCPNYGTRKMLIQYFINKKSEENGHINIPLNFDLSVLAACTERYAAGSFKLMIDRVLTTRRLKRIQDEPLKISEFLGPLINIQRVTMEEYAETKKRGAEVQGLKDRQEAREKPVDDKGKDPKKKK